VPLSFGLPELAESKPADEGICASHSVCTVAANVGRPPSTATPARVSASHLLAPGPTFVPSTDGTESVASSASSASASIVGLAELFVDASELQGASEWNRWFDAGNSVLKLLVFVG